MTRMAMTQGSRGRTLVLEGDLTIQHVLELRDALVRAAEEPGALWLDVSGVERLDMAGLQVLSAAERGFSDGLRLTGSVPETIRQVVQEAGLENERLWTSGVTDE